MNAVKHTQRIRKIDGVVEISDKPDSIVLRCQNRMHIVCIISPLRKPFAAFSSGVDNIVCSASVRSDSLFSTIAVVGSILTGGCIVSAGCTKSH